jgi:hypothetical protein
MPRSCPPVVTGPSPQGTKQFTVCTNVFILINKRRVNRKMRWVRWGRQKLRGYR